jgi:hypothetical protein
MLTRWLTILVGVVLGSVAAGFAWSFALPFQMAMSPTGEGMNFVLLDFMMSLMMSADGPESGMRFLRMFTLAIGFAPVLIAALIGETASSRSALFYATCAGIAAALAPFLLMQGRAYDFAQLMQGKELRLAVPFFLGGLVGGYVYWMVAGKRAGLRDDIKI